MAHSDTYRAAFNGCEMRYRRVGAGEPVVLVHTLRTQLEYFRPLTDEIDTTRYDVIALDLPGHGESTAPRVDYTADYFSDAVEALLEHCGLHDTVLVGESIGGSIALILAARGNPRLRRVVAINPYDYGRWGGIRRSSRLNNVIFTTMLWPGVGPLVPYAATPGLLSLVMAGGLHDRKNLPQELVDDMHRCGLLPGHPRAFRSLSQQWRSWIAAREKYRSIELPVTLVYGQEDWSAPAERDANAEAIPGARAMTLGHAGHFSCLETPTEIASLIMAPTGADGQGPSPLSHT
jgi:pimeloyl-ACP methyl ester carboxylesterase